MSTAIDATLLEGHEPWSEVAYGILDEMASRGNMIALYRKNELQKLAEVLARLPPPKPAAATEQVQDDLNGFPASGHHLHPPKQMGTSNLDYPAFDSTFWPDELTAEQLVLVADGLDLDGLDWMTASLEDSSAQSQIL